LKRLLSSLLLIVAILLGIILRSSLGNRLDKSILLVLLGEEKLLLTEFVITVEIVVSSEVEIIQLGFELFKARIPYNLDFALALSVMVHFAYRSLNDA
jgi:hypothetical protein